MKKYNSASKSHNTRVRTRYMEGFYVDTTHCLNIVTLPETVGRDKTEQATVYRASSDDPRGHCANLTRVSARGARVRLYDGDSWTRDGIYNGSDCIIWNDGTRWHRLKISHTQASLMSRRPYIPMTFLFLVCTSAFFSWVSDATMVIYKKIRKIRK